VNSVDTNRTRAGCRGCFSGRGSQVGWQAADDDGGCDGRVLDGPSAGTAAGRGEGVGEVRLEVLEILETTETRSRTGVIHGGQASSASPICSWDVEGGVARQSCGRCPGTRVSRQPEGFIFSLLRPDGQALPGRPAAVDLDGEASRQRTRSGTAASRLVLWVRRQARVEAPARDAVLTLEPRDQCRAVAGVT